MKYFPVNYSLPRDSRNKQERETKFFINSRRRYFLLSFYNIILLSLLRYLHVINKILDKFEDNFRYKYIEQ